MNDQSEASLWHHGIQERAQIIDPLIERVGVVGQRGLVAEPTADVVRDNAAV